MWTVIRIAIGVMAAQWRIYADAAPTHEIRSSCERVAESYDRLAVLFSIMPPPPVQDREPE